MTSTEPLRMRRHTHADYAVCDVEGCGLCWEYDKHYAPRMSASLEAREVKGGYANMTNEWDFELRKLEIAWEITKRHIDKPSYSGQLTVGAALRLSWQEVNESMSVKAVCSKCGKTADEAES